jgi:hypothetical protein
MARCRLTPLPWGGVTCGSRRDPSGGTYADSARGPDSALQRSPRHDPAGRQRPGGLPAGRPRASPSPRDHGRGAPYLQGLHRHHRLARRRGLAPQGPDRSLDTANPLASRAPSSAAARPFRRPLHRRAEKWLRHAWAPWRAACKPSSVPCRCRHRFGDGHPSVRPTRGLDEQPAPARAPGFALLFGLAPARACRVSLPLARASSLWRWSSPHGGRALPASLLCGARTFLGRRLSTIASAAVRPPPGRAIVLDRTPVRNRRCGALSATRAAGRWRRC